MVAPPYQLGADGTEKAQGCPFLDVLPLEIRQIIYEYVMMDKVVLNLRSHEYDMKREELMRDECAEHSYHFHTSILLTSRQISNEASKTCRRKFSFVSLTTQRRSRLPRDLENHGLPVIAKGRRAGKIPSVLMKLIFDDGDLLNGWWPWFDDNDELPLYYIFASDDLSAFCMSLLRSMRANRTNTWNVPLHIAIEPCAGDPLPETNRGCFHAQPRLRRLLESLRQLRGMQTVTIQASVNESYKEELIDSMCAPPESSQAAIEKVSQALNHGDRAYSIDLTLAVSIYTAGLDAILCSDVNDPAMVDVFDQETRTTQPFSEAIPGFKKLLHVRLAACYLEMGHLRAARTYAERVYGPRHGYDDRANRTKLPLEVEPDEMSLFAQVMAIAANISYLHDNVWEADRELEEAIRLGLDRDDCQLLQEDIDARKKVLNQRWEHKRHARYLRRRLHDEKAEFASVVALSRRNKGDEAFRGGNFVKAISKYKSAMAKTEALEDSEGGWLSSNDDALPLYYPIDGHLLILQARIASAYLRLSDFKEAWSWADVALRNDRSYDSETKPWFIFASPYHKMALWCKAIALENMGKLDGAVRNMERALEYDPGDAHVFYRLGALKEALGNQKIFQKNVRQKQLRKKDARKGKAKEKRSKGMGYFVGSKIL